jgi:hypothetical protein
VNKRLLRKIHQLTGGGLQMDFGDMHVYDWTNKRGKKENCEKGAFTISFFNSGWRFLRDEKILFACNDYFEDVETLRKFIKQEIENAVDILLIEKKNKYDYKLYFSKNIILETFELSEGRNDPPLYLTDKEAKVVLDINLLCDYKESVPEPF